jgi:cob(I)alamin adenosyltransferase
MSSSRGTRRERIADSAVATGHGDDGTTGLLYGGRTDKDDLAVEAYGTIDETVTALGIARAELGASAADSATPAVLATLAEVVLHLQRDLFVAGAELASNPDAVGRLQDGITRVDESMLAWAEETLATWEGGIEMPREFVVPGETRASAALEVARATMRRAERRVIALRRSGHVTGPWLVPWLNRIADLLWVLARAAEQAEHARSVPATLAGRGIRGPA